MQQITIVLDYLSIDNNIVLIDEPARDICKRVIADHRPLFEKAPGSTYNHHTWPGGYIDHVTECMNYARHQYALDSAFARGMPFSLSDALLILFLHDLEKPWRILVDATGTATNRLGLDTKEAHKKFREDKLAEYGLCLTPYQQNGLTYVEGEGKAYSSKQRVMNELAAFCHRVDTWSARERYDHPRTTDDGWISATRFRST